MNFLIPDKKLTDNEIKKALEYCSKQGTTSECEKCKMPKNTCRTELIGYALDYINRLQAEKEELQELVNEMSDYFPACIGCEGKTEDGVRTDKCVFLIDKTNYCVKRGISNIVAIRKENAELKAGIERLQEEIELLHSDHTYKIVKRKAKAEAYKEFLPLLEKFRNEVVDKFIIMCDGNDYNKLNLMSMVDTIDCIYDKHIDNLLKETIGE